MCFCIISLKQALIAAAPFPFSDSQPGKIGTSSITAKGTVTSSSKSSTSRSSISTMSSSDDSEDSITVSSTSTSSSTTSITSGAAGGGGGGGVLICSVIGTSSSKVSSTFISKSYVSVLSYFFHSKALQDTSVTIASPIAKYKLLFLLMSALGFFFSSIDICLVLANLKHYL